MRVFLAGAGGVIGRRLVPLLIADGHRVAAMTRTAEKAEPLRSLGAEPVICDVFDLDRLQGTVTGFAPDLVMHQLTDLPDRLDQLGRYAARNDRMRIEGTRHLLAAATAAGEARVVAQSIAWRPTGRAAAVEALERQVLGAGGLVIRYGQLYGPGTFYEHEYERPPHPRVGLAAAASATATLLDAPAGVVVLAEDEHGHLSPRRVPPTERTIPDGNRA